MNAVSLVKANSSRLDQLDEFGVSKAEKEATLKSCKKLIAELPEFAHFFKTMWTLRSQKVFLGVPTVDTSRSSLGKTVKYPSVSLNLGFKCT